MEYIIRQESKEKKKALIGIKKFPKKDELNPNAIASPAPKLAAEDKPRVCGPAKGLSSIACISAPAIPKDAPTVKAVNATGNRKDHRITTLLEETDWGKKNAAIASSKLSHVEPVKTSIIKLKKTNSPKAISIMVFLFVI
jgi:hypothetical protein